MGMLEKTESGADKIIVLPKTWTFIYFGTAKKSEFTLPVKGVYEWNVILRVEYPKGATGTVLRGRLERYPNKPKADETGHDDKNTSGWAGQTYHSHWSHFLTCDKTMPIGFKIWHNGTKPIVIDGRQIKATKVGA